jgi:hypothetical protein
MISQVLPDTDLNEQKLRVFLKSLAKEFLKEQDRKRNLKASIKRKMIEKGKSTK